MPIKLCLDRAAQTGAKVAAFARQAVRRDRRRNWKRPNAWRWVWRASCAGDQGDRDSDSVNHFHVLFMVWLSGRAR